MPKRWKRPRHWCRVCQRQRPNEAFSRKGRRRHVCRACAKLGPEELAVGQHLRDMERCLTFDGFVRRKRRAEFERYLVHEDPRVREAAKAIQRENTARREAERREWFAYEIAEIPWVFLGPDEGGPPPRED